MNFKTWMAILLAFMLLMMVCCTGPPGNLNIFGKIWNTEIGCTPVAVVVNLNGPISMDWVVDIEEAMQARSCELVVLCIESPGGTITDTKLLTHKVQVLKEQYDVEIAAYSEKLLASGAYWFASVADNITLSPVAITGSIGAYVSRLDRTALDSIWGLKWYYITSGTLKTMGNPHISPSQTEFMVWKQFIQKTYNDFLEVIWHSRADVLFDGFIHTHGVDTIPIDSLDVKIYLTQLADGRIYDAEDAFTYGLVDAVMYFDEYIEKLREHYKVKDLNGKKLN